MIADNMAFCSYEQKRLCSISDMTGKFKRPSLSNGHILPASGKQRTIGSGRTVRWGTCPRRSLRGEDVKLAKELEPQEVLSL